jgi:hypothetical protein
MSQSTQFVDCNQVQTDLMTAWNYNNLGHDGAVGLQFVLSPLNRNGFMQKAMNMKDNGLLEVQVIFDQRFLESAVSDSGVIACEDGGVDGELSETYLIDPTVGSSLSLNITPAQLRARCKKNPAYLAGRLKKMMDALIERADSKFFASIAANTGNFAYDVDTGLAAGTNSFVTTSTRNAQDVLIPNANNDVTFHYALNGFNSMPFGFGFKEWADYAAYKKAAGLSEIGIDAAKFESIYPFGFAFTHKAASLFPSANDAIFVAPGTVQMIDFTEFMDTGGSIDSFNNGGDLIQGTLTYPDARYPLNFDYRAEYVCSGTVRHWRISIAFAYKFIYLPEDMYQVGDRKEGVNGINRFRITNP